MHSSKRVFTFVLLKSESESLKSKIMTIEKAVANFLQFVQNGWNVEVALESCHDTVYDLISLKDFGTKCLRAVGVDKIANLNHN